MEHHNDSHFFSKAAVDGILREHYLYRMVYLFAIASLVVELLRTFHQIKRNDSAHSL